MLNTTQAARLARKCANSLAAAVDSLPKLLDQAEPEAAASIVADLVKTLVSRPLPEPDPGAELQKLVREVRRNAERRDAECDEEAAAPAPAPDYPRTFASVQPEPIAREAPPLREAVPARPTSIILASSSLEEDGPFPTL